MSRLQESLIRSDVRGERIDDLVLQLVVDVFRHQLVADKPERLECRILEINVLLPTVIAQIGYNFEPLLPRDLYTRNCGDCISDLRAHGLRLGREVCKHRILNVLLELLV